MSLVFIHAPTFRPIFQDEIRQIVKKRAGFEAALVRRVARKSDFLKYIAYEMDLEALRRKRVKRLRECYS